MLEEEWEIPGEFNSRICSVLENYTENFLGFGKMNATRSGSILITL